MGGVSTFSYVAGAPITGIDTLGLQRSAVRYAPNPVGGVSPGNDGYLIHGDGYASGSATSEIPLLPGPRLLTDALVASFVISASPGIWKEMLGQFSQRQDDCPIPGTTPEGTTKGNTRIEKKPGDFGTANGDFDNQWPGGVSDKGGGIRVGTLEDGRTIIVRPNSKEGSPTIEIQSGGRTRVKIRYVK